MPEIVLASGSETRAGMLRRAGVDFRVSIARVDEDALRASLQAEGVKPRDIADALAEMKALRVGRKEPGAVTIGADQILALGSEILTKPATRAEAEDQLRRLRGQTHILYSAAVAVENAEPVWRHIAEARMTMHRFSDDYLSAYLDRAWPEVGSSVGAYRIEEEGIRLFSAIHGDYFAILGMPLVQLLAWLGLRGIIET